MSEPTVNPDLLEIAPGSAHEDLQGWVPDLATPEETRLALEKAFNYRGDVTITLKDGATVTGYLFDRRPAATLAESLVRIIPTDTTDKLSIPYSGIAHLAFKRATVDDDVAFAGLHPDARDGRFALADGVDVLGCHGSSLYYFCSRGFAGSGFCDSWPCLSSA